MRERVTESASTLLAWLPSRTSVVVAGWAFLALWLGALAALLGSYSEAFDNNHELIDIPALPLAAGLVAAGLGYASLVWLVPATLPLAPPVVRAILLAMIATGLALRVAMLATTPALEDDFYRYLWDGAVVAQGINPYRYAPESADDIDAPDALTSLMEHDLGGDVHSRINHSGLKTIYPPTAQAAFLLAYSIEPWSLGAWRAVCLAAEVATLVLMFALLSHLGRSPLWSALYWLNPVVIKELLNSAHMEAVLIPLVLGAVLLALAKRPILSAVLLGLALATKLWPVILAPILYRNLLANSWRLAGVALVLGASILIALLPPLLGGLDETSGFVAYAGRWQTNSALVPTLERLLAIPLSVFGDDGALAGRAARLIVAAALAATVLVLARDIPCSDQTLTARLALAVTALVLLAPAQFPWYLTWAVLLLPLHPQPGLIVATVLMPVYYASFYFHAHDTYAIFRDWVVWAIWLPIWGTFIIQQKSARQALARRKIA